MPNILQLTVEQPDEILNAGAYGAGALMRLQSGATEAGPFSDVSGTGSTPTTAVVAGVRSYTAYDPAGTSSTWYRTRFENVGGTRLSDWSAAFQVGDETAGLICSVVDVVQNLGGTASDNDEELILEKIREVTTQVEEYCGRWFSPRPLAGTTTLLLSPGWDPFARISKGGLVLNFPRGVRAITTFEYATIDQPTSGGTYTSIPSTGYVLVPGSTGWPSTRVVLMTTTGPLLRPGLNTIRWLGSFGFAAVPADVQGVGQRAVVRRFLGKETAAPTVAVGPSGSMLLRDMSPDDARILERYRDRSMFVASSSRS